MKPHRVKMAHSLIVHYGLANQMEVSDTLHTYGQHLERQQATWLQPARQLTLCSLPTLASACLIVHAHPLKMAGLTYTISPATDLAGLVSKLLVQCHRSIILIQHRLQT